MPLTLPAPEIAKATALAGAPKARAAEVVRISWPAPVGDQYYAALPFDDPVRCPGYDGIVAHLGGKQIIQALASPKGNPAIFIPLVQSADIGDETVNLKFADLKGELADLDAQYGADYRVKVFRYYPDVDWWKEVWDGILDSPSQAGESVFETTATVGVRVVGQQVPRRLQGAPGCQFIYGGVLSSQAEIDEGGCPVNVHVGGSIGLLNPATNPCAQLDKSDCIAQIGDALDYGGTDLSLDSHVVSQSKGAGIQATVQGNETVNSQAMPVAAGLEFIAYELPVKAITPETNTNHPDKAALRVLCFFSTGPIGGIDTLEIYVNDTPVQPQNQNIRLGTARQPATGYSANVSNFSRVAHGYLVIFGNWAQAKSDQFKVRVKFTSGYTGVRRYTNATTYTTGATENRAAWLYTFRTEKIWGEGRAHSEFEHQDWADLANWCEQTVNFTDSKGKARSCKRATFNELVGGRELKEVIKDFCLWGGFSTPLRLYGKSRIMPLIKEPDLAAVPVFHDEDYQAERPNIAWQQDRAGNRATVLYSRKRPRDLVYQLNITFYDRAYKYKPHPLTLRNPNYQIEGGRKIGAFQFNQNAKSYRAFGITYEDEAVYHAERIYLLGEFDGCDASGPGLLNNLEITFVTWYWYKEIYQLHKFKVIRVLSNNVQRATRFPQFEYFRIKAMREEADQRVVITAVPYIHSFYDRESVVVDPPPPPPIDYPLDFPYGRPYGYGIGDLLVEPDRVSFFLN